MGKPARPIVHARAFGSGGGKGAAAGTAPPPASSSGGGGGGKRKKPSGDKQQHHQQQQHPTKRPKQQQQHQQQNPNAWRASTVIDQQAARFLSRLLDAARTRKGGATVKSLCLADGVEHKRATYAVTCETLKHLPALRAAVERSGLIERHAPNLGEALACVLAYEALLGQGLPGGGGGEEGDGDVGDVGNVGNKSSKQQSRHRAGPAEDAVREGLPALRRALADLQREHGASSVLELASRLAGGSGGEGGSAAAAAAGAAKAPNDEQHQHWRSVRVNALKLPTVETALAELDKEKGGSGGASAPSSSAAALRDPLLPELLLFPPGTDLHAHPLVRSGALILQSRASCLPARALAPKPGWTVLDACAAPGNKTTHLAALVGGGAAADSKNKKQARVLAFDRDPRRLELLRRNVERAGASSIVRAERADFLALDPLAPQFAAVRAVLLDPSCSGSGTAAARQLAGGGLLSSSAGVGPTEEEEEKNAAAAEDGGAEPAADERVEQLARFQATALKHALKFPKCERVSYSTCSVYRRENEAVVAEVLADSEVAAAGWRLADPFPSMRGGGGGKSKEKAGVAPMYGRRGWPHPGLPAGQERLLVRTDAALDGTDGFFVALFVRDLGGKATTR